MVNEQKVDFAVELVRSLTKIALEVIFWAGILGIGYFTYCSILALSGKKTVADIKLNTTAAFSLNPDDLSLTLCTWVGILSLVIAAISIMYGRWQARLRRNTVESLQGRIKELETSIDSSRTSSNLTTRGETREGDQ